MTLSQYRYNNLMSAIFCFHLVHVSRIIGYVLTAHDLNHKPLQTKSIGEDVVDGTLFSYDASSPLK